MRAGNASLLALLLCFASTIAPAQENNRALRWTRQLSSTSPSYRAQAATELARMGVASRASIPSLLPLLQDAEPNVRLCAAHAIGSIGGSPIKLTEGLSPLLDDADEHVRYTAEWAIARLSLLGVAPSEEADYRQLLLEVASKMRDRDHHAGHIQVIEQAISLLSPDRIAQRETPKLPTALVHAPSKQNSLRPIPALPQPEVVAKLPVATPSRQGSPPRPVIAKISPAKTELLGSTPPNMNSAISMPLAAMDVNVASREAVRELSQATANYLNAEQVERLLIIHRAAYLDQPDTDELDQLRASLLKTALIEFDYQAVHLAKFRWRSHKNVIGILFDQIASVPAPMPDWIVDVLDQIVPVDATTEQRLAKIVRDRRNDEIVRTAAIEALIRSSVENSIGPHVLAELLKAREGETESLLAQSATYLGTCPHERSAHLGHIDSSEPHQGWEKDQQLHTALMSILRDKQSSWRLRSSVAAALARILPDASIAAREYARAIEEQDLFDYELRDALEILGSFGPCAADVGVGLASEALTANDDLTRAEAAKALASFASPTDATTNQLIERVLSSDETADVRIASAIALEELAPNSLANLVERSRGCEETCQVQTLHILSQLGSEALPALEACEAIVEDPTAAPATRSAAALLIGQMGKSAYHAEIPLRNVLRQEESSPLGAAALLGLAQIGELETSDIQLVTGDSSNPSTVATAAYAGYLAGGKENLPKLVELLSADPHAPAAMALHDIGNSAAKPLLELVEDDGENEQRRLAAMHVLVQIPSDDYRPILRTLQDNEIGQACSDCAHDLMLEGGPRLLSDVLTELEAAQTPASRNRLLAFAEDLTSGVGAGGEGEIVEPVGDLAAMLQSEVSDQQGRELSPGHFVSEGTPAEGSSGSSAFGLPDPPTFPKATRSAPSFPAVVPPNELRPERNGVEGSDEEAAGEEVPIAANSPAFVPSLHEETQSLAADPVGQEDFQQGKTVRVFYGTNRGPITDKPGDLLSTEKLPQKAFAVSAALAVMLVGFACMRNRRWLGVMVMSSSTLLLIAYLGSQGIVETPWQIDGGRKVVGYGGEYTDQLKLGSCEVTIPPTHVSGELESPSIWKLELRPDPTRHVVLQKVEELDPEECMDQLRGELATKGDNLLVFVHGFNVKFEDAARRTAQLSHDLEFPGAAAFYSWPSRANWYQYPNDRKNIELSVVHIKEFLLKMAEESGAETIHLIAHSMGNVGLTAALAELNSAAPAPLFNQVVLAAPDIDAEVFRSRIAPRITNTAERFTMYSSPEDLALVASRYFNQGRRAGETVGPIATLPKFDVIDASRVDSSILGHSYYGGISVIHDLGELLRNRPIHDRTHLRSLVRDGETHWQFAKPQLAERNDENAARLR